MPAPTHICPTCKRPLEQRDQLILDLVPTAATYEEIAEQVGKTTRQPISVRTVRRVAARYGLSRPPGRPWPEK